MKKCMLGIGLLLFAILLKLCSSGIDSICLIIGVNGLVFTLLGAIGYFD